jgi:hypothetical protein
LYVRPCLERARPNQKAALSPEDRALAFLSREVPLWQTENHCHSCHNNGDATRALYLAIRMGKNIDRNAIAETTNWLSAPERWNRNGGDGPFNDRILARVQFASALADAVDTRLVANREPLERAARDLAADQLNDGSWPISGDATGSPATYGKPLATTIAREVLIRVDPRAFPDPINKADRWLLKLEPKSTTEAAAILLRTSAEITPEWRVARRTASDLLRRGQSSSGGWGPYRTSPPETFDTALAVLALTTAEASRDTARAIDRGREFLITEQNADGSWPETTRPPGGGSYAQRISTAGWATLALLRTAR